MESNDRHHGSGDGNGSCWRVAPAWSPCSCCSRISSLSAQAVHRSAQRGVDRPPDRHRRIVLNPFTFTYGIHDLACMEPKGSDQVFVRWKEVSVKADLWDGWRRTSGVSATPA